MSQRAQVVPLRGGLDLVTPAMMVKPGYVIGGQNYEPTVRGYQRCDGYERYDGRAAPSDATYLVVQFNQGTATITEGQTVTGLTSGASGLALVDMEVTSGSFGASNAAGRLVLHAITGTFQSGEFLQVGGVSKCRSADAGTVDGAPTDALHDTYIASVTSYRRDLIAAPAGSGAIRGVATYAGSRWCWRDNAGATACVLFKASTSGWVAQSFGTRLPFKEGTVEIVEGETVTGATSGATGVVRRIARMDGSWNATLPVADQASGGLTLSGVVGTFNAAENLTVGGVLRAKTNGAPTAITIPAGATIRPLVENYLATSSGERLYFTTTTGRAYEWDGTYLTPIHTGLSDALDKPTHIASHRGHLFLAFPGGSLQGSSTGDPLSFDAVTGAAEIGFGQEITGLLPHTYDSLVVFGRSKISYLVGADSVEYDLRPITESSGALANTAQVVGNPIFFDDLGLRDLTTSQAYGDWNIGSLTALVQPLLDSKKVAGVTPLGSLRVKSRAQYRVYFSDGTGLCVYLGRKDPETLNLTLGFTPTCFWQGEDAQGREILLAGASTGMVYQLDRGTSFDGSNIEAFLRLGFLNQDLPGTEKRYHRASLEGSAGTRGTVLTIGADFGYGDPDQPPAAETSMTLYGSGGFWNVSNWNEFFWSTQVEGQAWAEFDGFGENIAPVIASESATETPHTLSVLMIHWTARRRRR